MAQKSFISDILALFTYILRVSSLYKSGFATIFGSYDQSRRRLEPQVWGSPISR